MTFIAATRPALFRRPQYHGQFCVYRSAHAPDDLRVDRAEYCTDSVLEWRSTTRDPHPGATAALIGYKLADRLITEHEQSTGEPFGTGQFTLRQFKHFVANLTATNAFTVAGVMHHGVETMGVATIARQAFDTVLKVIHRPLANAIYALKQMGVFMPKEFSGDSLARQTEIQRLIYAAQASTAGPAARGKLIGALVYAQNGMSSDEDYGLFLSGWIQSTMPDIVQRIPKLSPEVSRSISRGIAFNQSQTRPCDDTITRDYLGFPKGTLVSDIQARLKTLSQTYIDSAGIRQSSDLQGKNDLDRYTLSVLIDLKAGDTPPLNRVQTLMTAVSVSLDHYQVSDVLSEVGAIAGGYREHEAKPAGVFSTDCRRIPRGSSDQRAQYWVILEGFNGHPVTPRMVDQFARTFNLSTISEPALTSDNMTRKG